MTSILKRVLVGFSILAAVGGPAAAGGDYDTRGYSGVPVPAPIPVPLYDPVWYFRIDATLGLSDAPDASESGLLFGESGRYRADPVFGTGASWLDNHDEQSFMWGAGVGFRWNSWLRMDVTGETKREQKVTIKGRGESELVDRDDPAVTGTYVANISDEAIMRGGVVLFNAYYDFGRWGGFRPYVGGGIGFAVTEIARKNLTRERALDDTGSTLDTVYNDDTDTRHHAVGLAAAATVGVTYQITDITDLDLSYRYLWIDGFTSSLGINGNQSTIDVDDVSDHQLRAGLRFNVN